MHRRTAVVGVLLAASVLTACGGDGLTAGTAVVLDGRRIPIGAVEARVSQLRDGTGGASTDAREQPDAPARQAVTDLVLDAVVARALSDRRLTVTGAEVAAARAAEQERFGGAGQLSRALAGEGVPEGAIDAYYRRQLGLRRLAAAAGQDATTPAGDAVVRRALADAAIALHLRVNPRYGTWDPEHVALLPDNPPWLTPPG
ncbi:hypothetical protein ACFVVX_35935 [Kitasatospora sp. NPDC058170]|uniref:hypothetical protein n=1 Tax=Kitasatospora sp. NPDC058170 TaxID=3346364 RepID=UPI0036DEBA4A